jgi:hypothetical protein
MSKPIKISYIWNKNNIDKLFEASYKYLFENSSKRYIGWFFIAMAQFGVVALFKKGSFALLLFSTIILVYWYYVKKLIAKKRAIKAFEESPFKNKRIDILVDENGFKTPSNNRSWKWEDIQKVIPVGEDILIYNNPNFHYIPSSGFKSIEDKSYFKSLAKQHGVLE